MIEFGQLALCKDKTTASFIAKRKKVKISHHDISCDLNTTAAVSCLQHQEVSPTPPSETDSDLVFTCTSSSRVSSDWFD